MTRINCTDGGCIFGHPGGMATNGGCKCVQRHALSVKDWIALKRKIQTQTQTVKEQKESLEELHKKNKLLRKLLFDGVRLVDDLLGQQAMPDPGLDTKIDLWKSKVE